MGSKNSAIIAVLNKQGHQQGELILEVPPKAKADAPALLDLQDDLARPDDLEPVQLLEGTEYRYSFKGATGVVTTDRDEIFFPDGESGCTGSLRPGLYTGTMRITVFLDGQEWGRVAFEVRSRKMDYLRHYRWMVRDVAESFAEVVMSRFAPAEQRFALDETQDAATSYQRFAFLRSLIEGEAFEAAMQQILMRPHRNWVVEEEVRPPGRSMAPSSHILRQLAAPGPRVPWTTPGSPLPSLPALLRVQRTEETLDTPENRFVKFALSRWRDVVAGLGSSMVGKGQGGPLARGQREVQAVLDRLDDLLTSEIFREVGNLTHFPAGSQVLQKRPGYRDIFRAYVQFEAAAVLSWQGGEDVYSAGQRDVATLYEYWVFLQVADVVSELCQVPFDRAALFDVQPDGVQVSLRRGRRSLLKGFTTRNGRHFSLQLWFNRTFSTRDGATWSRSMRPDCSLEISAEDESGVTFEPVWLHFDAKYRVESVAQMFGPNSQTEEEESELLDQEQRDAAGIAKRSDLLKMHAYRDAIKRSAGAYVVYPGTKEDVLKAYHEILPGLGAFALRPTEDGAAEGSHALRKFINDVLSHLASQGSQHERGRFWLREVYRERFHVPESIPAAPFLVNPPADTRVLLAFVRDERHLEWIHRHGLYNLRADGRGRVGLGGKELAAEFVVLSGPTLKTVELWRVDGDPFLLTKARLLELDYPRMPSVDVYYCLPLKPTPLGQLSTSVTRAQVEIVRARAKPGSGFGLPVATTWLELFR